MTYFNGTHSILVGVVSFSYGLCATEGQLDGFAKVSQVLDWIRKYGDEYVNSCSGRLDPIVKKPF